jgi:hypothetical protein
MNLFHITMGSRISCFSHILNLSVQDFMKAANKDSLSLIPGQTMENDVNEFVNDAEAATETNVLKRVKRYYNKLYSMLHG